MKKRIWLTLFFLFVMAGTISYAFNVLLEGAYPVIQFFSGGFFVSVVYGLFTSLLCICKKELKTPSKMFLSFIHVFCTFGVMGYIAVIFTKHDPMWWMYLVWLVIAIIVACKSYMDANKG